MRALLLPLLLGGTSACSVALAGRKATADGATLLLHTDDCANCDFRLARSPPRDLDPNEPVLAFHEAYPREVSTRTATYDAKALDPRIPAWRSDEWVNNQTLGTVEAISSEAAAAFGAVAAGGRGYGSIEGLYAMVNTEQVALVESTSSASAGLFSPARPPAKPGAPTPTSADGALWDVSALSKAALRRCGTARCAIDVMGYLAVGEGFYGQHGLPAEYMANGEALLVADANEAWAFHIAPLPPNVSAAAGAGTDGVGKGAHSAVWVAQRVPDEHIVIAANRFIIRDVVEVAPDDSTKLTRACRGDTFRHSSNLFAVAEYLAKLDPNPKPLENLDASRRGVRLAPGQSAGGLRVIDFLVHFGGDTHVQLAPYSNDRLWRMLSLFAADKHWAWPPPTPLATDVYPFSVAPSKLLTHADFISLSRDVYRGVKHPGLDLTKGLASGPGGDPSRYDVPSAFTPPGAGGSFPRAISMFRTSYSHVTEIGRPAPGGKTSRAVGARVWASQGAPHASVYTPLHMLPAGEEEADAIDEATVKCDDSTDCTLLLAASPASPYALPRSYTRGSLHRADVFDGVPSASSQFWRTTFLNNWARAVGYDHVWHTLEAAQAREEEQSAKDAHVAEAAAAAAGTSSEAAALLAEADRKAASRSAIAWHHLITELMSSLHDGYRADVRAPVLGIEKLFYPAWWLEKVGFYGPRFYPCLGNDCVKMHTTLAQLGQPGQGQQQTLLALAHDRIATPALPHHFSQPGAELPGAAPAEPSSAAEAGWGLTLAVAAGALAAFAAGRATAGGRRDGEEGDYPEAEPALGKDVAYERFVA